MWEANIFPDSQGRTSLPRSVSGGNSGLSSPRSGAGLARINARGPRSEAEWEGLRSSQLERLKGANPASFTREGIVCHCIMPCKVLCVASQTRKDVYLSSSEGGVGESGLRRIGSSGLPGGVISGFVRRVSNRGVAVACRGPGQRQEEQSALGGVVKEIPERSEDMLRG